MSGLPLIRTALALFAAVVFAGVAVGGPVLLAQTAAASPAVVAGRVHLQQRADHAGVIVQVGGPSATTASDGSFLLADAPTGPQVVRASAPGFLSAEAKLDISPGQHTNLAEVTLPGGDVNGDGVIQLWDLVALGAAYGQCPPQDPRLDLTADGRLNIYDLVILGNNYGRTGPIPWAALPEATATPIPYPQPSPTPTPTLAEAANEALCTRVIDGDTIEIATGQRVRLIGIDAPELNGAECYAIEATMKAEELMQGKVVRLEKDVSETDRYGRLLRYVLVGETMVNAELVRQGYALAYTYPPDVRYADALWQLQQEARDANRGLWSACSTPTPTATMAPIGGNLRLSAMDCYAKDEWVEIRNDGTAAQALTGWSILSVVGLQRYYLPQGYILPAGGSVRIHSGPEALDDPPDHLLWGRTYLWNNGGDTAELRDAQDRLIDSRACAAAMAMPTPVLTPDPSAACIGAEEAWDHLGENRCVDFHVVSTYCNWPQKLDHVLRWET